MTMESDREWLEPCLLMYMPAFESRQSINDAASLIRLKNQSHAYIHVSGCKKIFYISITLATSVLLSKPLSPPIQTEPPPLNYCQIYSYATCPYPGTR